ncbi:hypothetical protein DUNSADRAFT_15657 [Dunaliella salina]|uniref:Encoded protein n=1 Tax=Dunaliella salina TaxID=3046 RepID=A0ABQ7G507_DUNSA|nr:hypothetical protein DUNSADRAFT_15657 [Dunaliella salina]|eukprot:KAF5829682.1 hypothetical protein DUNSADRAFT_15657 [Dunaliella salina]
MQPKQEVLKPWHHCSTVCLHQINLPHAHMAGCIQQDGFDDHFYLPILPPKCQRGTVLIQSFWNWRRMRCTGLYRRQKSRACTGRKQP